MFSMRFTAGRAFAGIDQSRLDQPLVGSKRFHVITPVGEPRGDTDEAVTSPEAVSHVFRDGLSRQIADQGSGGTWFLQHEVVHRTMGSEDGAGHTE